MSTICHNSKKVILEYTSVTANKIAYKGKKHYGTAAVGNKLPYGTNNYFEVHGSPTTVITWNSTPNPANNHYRYKVSFTHANTNIEPSNKEFFAYFHAKYEVAGIIFDENNLARYSLSYLDNEGNPINLEPLILPAGNSTGFVKADAPNTTSPSHVVLNMTIGEREIDPVGGMGWNFNWFFNDVPVGSRNVNTNPGANPNNNAFPLEAEPGETIIQEYFFSEPSNKVELIKDPTDSYSWSMKKTINEVEEIVDTFFAINPQLLCFANNNECPENSCTVDCGNHYCCYNSQGYSVYAFSK